MKNLIIFSFLFLILFSCYKLEENDKRYSARKLQKMLEGTWEVTDYQIDGISYLDTFFKVNVKGNCSSFTFTQWKNTSSGGKESSSDLKTGNLHGNCSPNSFDGHGYAFYPQNKKLVIGSFFLIDSIYFFQSNGFKVLKLEKNELIITEEKNGHNRRINFSKQ